MNPPRSTSRWRRLARRGVAAGAGAAAALTLGVGTASATPDLTTTSSRATARIIDVVNGLLLFINKSREDLCTPERLGYEAEIIAWFESGMMGDPPVEPAGTDVGEVALTQTSRFVDSRELFTLSGEVPVEVWRLDGEEGGIDCSATDGPGAELFATGTMNYVVSRRFTDTTVSGDLRVWGVVTDTLGDDWNYEVRYKLKNTGGHDLYVQPSVRLVPLG